MVASMAKISRPVPAPAGLSERTCFRKALTSALLER
jgi:hypothetical protein